MPDKKSKTFDDIYRLHVDILKNQDEYMQNNLLVDKLSNLLQLIDEAGNNITDNDQHKLLESFAGYWRIIIQGNKDLKINIDLPDEQTLTIQKILTFYGEEEQLEIQDFLFSSLKQIAIPDFDEKLMSFIWETLAYYWEILEEVEQVERSIFCLCQVAYLKSLYDIIINFLDEKVKSSLSDFLGNRYIYELFTQQRTELENAGWKLELDGDIQDRDTSEQGKILFLFYESKLAEILEHGFQSFMGVTDFLSKITDFYLLKIAQLLSDQYCRLFSFYFHALIQQRSFITKLLLRVKRNTHKHLIYSLKQGGDLTQGLTDICIKYCNDIDQKKLQDKYRREAIDEEYTSIRELTNQYLEYEPKKYEGINKYLKEKIARKFDNPEKATVFHEPFTFKDIYVPLKASESGRFFDDNQEIFDLKYEAIRAIKTRERRDQVLCIEGEAGSGKSTFCRMLADWTLKHLHPLWTPILIKLRDVQKLGNNFQETLEIILDKWKFTYNNDWLQDKNTCFLFLLDGLDELLTEQSSESVWDTLLQQAIEFQHECGLSEEIPKHQVLITTNSVMFQSPSLSFEQLERVKIQPIDKKFLHQWLKKWKNLVYTEKIQDLEDVLNTQLERSSDPDEGWLKEPLLLYLVTAMYRDRILNIEDLNTEIEKLNTEKELTYNPVKSLIYNKLLDWVVETLLRKNSEEEDTGQRIKILQKALKDKSNTQTFKLLLTEAGLCAIQSGGMRSSIAMLEERLDKRLAGRSKQFAKLVFEQAKKVKEIKYSLTALLFVKNGQVNFLHKSFSEFLYAQRLLESLEDWTKLWENESEFVISRDRMDWEIYDLLGFGGLTTEIIEYLRGSLKLSKILSDKNTQEQLLERLKDFYGRWFEGKFVNEEISTTWPEKKMVELQKQMSSKGLFLGRRLIDIYTGLNVLILLLELSRQNQESQTRFYPCGSLPSSQCAKEATFRLDEQTDPFEPSRLLRLIGYSRWLGTDVFVKTVGPFLEEINLRGADLRGAELSGVKLNKAYLSDSLLNGINLSGAELKQAFLGNAQLHCADLSRTNLTNAFLGNANLSGAYLEKATLVRAVLAGANLRTAHLVNANCKDACLGDADLSDANLRGAKLKNANFSCSNLSDANLQGADLSGADLTSSVLTGCNFSDANLTGANLTGANLTDIIHNEKTQWNLKTLQHALIGESQKKESLKEKVTEYLNNKSKTFNPST